MRLRPVLLVGLLLALAAMIWPHLVRQTSVPKSAEKAPVSTSTVYTDRECLARNMAFETLGNSHLRVGAREELEAITRVVLRRVELGRKHSYRNTICEVVYQQNQFSWTRELAPDTLPKAAGRWEFMLSLADTLLAGKFEHTWPEANRCVTHYKRTDNKGVGKKPNKWFRKKLRQVAIYGNHTFYCTKKPQILRAQGQSAAAR